MTLRGTLASAALAAGVLSADLVLLVLYLNPGRSLSSDLGALATNLFAPWALLAFLAFAGVAVLGRTLGLGPRGFHPPLPDLPWFTTLMLVATSLSSGLFWLNLFSWRHAIPVPAIGGLVTSAIVLTLAAAVLLLVALDAFFFPLQPLASASAVVVLAPLAALVVPLALLPPPGREPRPAPVATEVVRPTRRIVLLGLDGLGGSRVAEAVSKGRLPSFARLIRRGASGSLGTLNPTEGPPIWTTIFTGRLPRDHGIKSFSSYRLAGSDGDYELLPKGTLVSWLERLRFVERRPVTAASRKRRALWEVMNAFGIATGVVRVAATHPAEQVQGFMVSPYFHLLRDEPARLAQAVFPHDLLAEIAARVVRPTEIDPALIDEFLPPGASSVDPRARRILVEDALGPDLTYDRVGKLLRKAYDPPFFASYAYGLDVVGHEFLQHSRPEEFGDVGPADVRLYGRVLERYESLAGQWVAEAEQALRPGELLVVISGYGMDPVPLWRRVLDWMGGVPARGGSHESAPDGFFLVAGDGVRAGGTVRGATVLDVAPTLLYLVGLPVARDMEGRVLTDMMDDSFLAEHPVSFIPSYESLRSTAPPPTAGGEALPRLPEDAP